MFSVFFCIWFPPSVFNAGAGFKIIPAKAESRINLTLPAFRELIPGVYFNKENTVVIMTRDNSCEELGELGRQTGGERNEKIFSCAGDRYLLIVSGCSDVSYAMTGSIARKCTGYIAEQLKSDERTLQEMIFDKGEKHGIIARRWFSAMKWPSVPSVLADAFK